VVPREHPVVEPDDEIGQRQIVVSRRRKTFERQAPVVGDVTGSATLKRRQSRQGLGRVRGDELAQRAEFARVQLRANRWTFLGFGMTHPDVIAAFDRLGGGARERLQETALTYC